MVEVEGTFWEEEAWVELFQYKWKDSGGELVLFAAVTECVELFAVAVQVEEELEFLVVLEGLELFADLDYGGLEGFVGGAPTTVHVITVDVATEITVDYAVDIYHWEKDKIEVLQ